MGRKGENGNLCVYASVCVGACAHRVRERAYPNGAAEEGWRVGEQVLGGLLHGGGVQQGLHGMFSGEAHVHQLGKHREPGAMFNMLKMR